tara:strand:+ start:4063 stop:5157 length:1095 start_codon:yes stop_codon:yes gene_type:complete
MIKICVFNGVRTDNGNYHYRGMEPWRILSHKDPNYAIKHINNIETNVLENSDVIFFQRLMGANVLEVAAYYKHIGKKIIYETDDHLQQVPDWNFWSGQYDKYTVQLYEAMLEIADVITTSTPNMVELCKKYNKNVVYCPNSINIHNFPLRPNNNKKPVIGSSISYTARSGDYIRSGVLEVLHKFKDKANIKILSGHAGKGIPTMEDTENTPFRALYPVDIDTSPEMVPDMEKLEGIEIIQVHPFLLHYQTMTMADLDIGIACQANHHFNKFKSNLKWLEYSMMGIPTIASKMPSYECINHMEDGILCETPEEWEEAIQLLIDKPEEGERLVKNARERILKEFNIAENYKNWKSAVDLAMEVNNG